MDTETDTETYELLCLRAKALEAHNERIQNHNALLADMLRRAQARTAELVILLRHMVKLLDTTKAAR